jgi:Carboxypeptidase regulatory-like domain/TonB-dependent Receptor Plug Domain
VAASLGLKHVSTRFSQKSTVAAAAFLFIAGLAAPAARAAQATGGSIGGTVTRGSGNRMPGVRVSLSDVTKTVSREVTTDVDGVYNLPALPPGAYEITVSMPGFVTQMWTGVNIGVGTERVLNIVMRPGDPGTVVRAAAPPAPVSQTSGCCGGNVNASTVRETPLNGRDWAQLVTLQAGVTGVQTGSATGAGNLDRGFGAPVSISGARPDQNSYRLDGISINDYANGAPGSVLGDNLGIDAVEQVSVLGSNYPAEYGRTSGGVINAVTRSGTNAFHGDVYEFLRNSALDARNFFDGPIPPFKRNQFGGSAGLPLRKDRTFIFGDYEGLRQSLGMTTVDTVPSAAVRGIGPNGSAVPSILCSIPQGPPNPCSPHPLTGAVNPDPATGIDKSVLNFLKGGFYPLPNGPLLGSGDTGIFTFAAQQVTTENYFTIRFDQKFSDKDTFYSTYMRDSSKTIEPGTFGELFSDVVSSRQAVTLHEQHLFNAGLLNVARMGFSRAAGITGQVTSVLNPLMADPSYGFLPGGFAGRVQTIPGVTDFLGAPTAQGFLSSSRFVFWNSYQAGDDVVLTRGIHALKFGVGFERMQDNQTSSGNINGSFRFDSLAQFLTNEPSAFEANGIPSPTDTGVRETLWGGYAQDDIRLRSSLIVNLGLRYEMVTAPTEAHHRTAVLRNVTDAQPIVGTPLFHNPTLRNFEPRVGFAWNPSSGKTLLRGGFGVFDVLPLPYEFTLSFQRVLPFFQTITSGNLPPGTFPTGAFQLLSGQTSSASAYFPDPYPKRNYVMQWNLSLARELSSTLAVTLGYVGSRGVHQPYRMDNIAMVLPQTSPAGYLWPCGADGGDPCVAGFLPSGTQSSPVPSVALNPNFGRINATLWQANSFYNALQADLAKRVSHGFQFHAAYTFGKSIDTLSATAANDSFPNGLFNQLFFDQGTTRGLSDFDVAQNFVLNFTWQVPGPKRTGNFLQWGLSGWQLGGLYKASTGQPFTPILGGDPLGTKLNETGEPPSYVSGCSLVDPNFKKNPDGPIYINSGCLALPQSTPAIAAQCQPFGLVPGVSAGIPGTCANLRGNLGRNSIVGPGLSKLDFSVFKNNQVKRISESFNVQFRAEIFNILNRTNFASPTDNLIIFDQHGLHVPSAGLITSTQTTSRQIQLALKVIW